MYRPLVSVALICGVLAATPAQADAVTGAKLFKQKCTVCHGLVAGQNKIGPSLAGVFGRKAGTAPAYAYSANFKGSSVKWDAASLDKYLTNPQGMFAGSKMVIKLPSATERADIIAYLKTNPKP